MTPLEKVAAGLAFGAAFAWGAAHLGEGALSGMVLRVDPRTPVRDAPVEIRAGRITSDALLFTPKVGREPARATFQGFLWVEREGPVEIRLRGNTPGRAWLDEALVLPTSGPDLADRATVRLQPGPHRLRVELDYDRKLPVFRLTVAGRGDDRGEDADPTLYPAPPDAFRRFVVRNVVPGLHVLAWALGAAAAALGLWIVLGWPTAGRPVSNEGGPWPTRTGVAVCALAIVAYGGLLRVESVVRQHWGLEAPAWARHAAALATEVRPASLKHAPAERPYFGDPANYLRFAREMERFYDAHVREPLFVAATRVGLGLSGNADVGISFASASFSVLLVAATFLLGARAFGPGIGLLAALLLAVERDVIGLAAEGWRDDAFAFWVVAWAAALLGLLARPSFGRALLLGLAGGSALLTRITALSFLLPAFAFAWWAARREPRAARGLARAALIATVLIAPFLATSKVAFGDAFHSINAHTRFYRSRAALPSDTPMTWPDYLARSFAPGELVRNLSVGLTVHPFENKWGPFALWARPAPRLLRLLAVVGLALFLWNRNGRLLLVILLTALVPFAFTFRITGGNEARFTLFAYPFYLVAAALAVARARAWVATRMR